MRSRHISIGRPCRAQLIAAALGLLPAAHATTPLTRRKRKATPELAQSQFLGGGGRVAENYLEHFFTRQDWRILEDLGGRRRSPASREIPSSAALASYPVPPACVRESSPIFLSVFGRRQDPNTTVSMKQRLAARRVASIGVRSCSEHIPRRVVALIYLAAGAGEANGPEALRMAQSFKACFKLECEAMRKTGGCPGGWPAEMSVRRCCVGTQYP